MSIKNRLTLTFLGIVTSLLLVFCIVIYLEAGYYRQSEFKERLRREAFKAATIFFTKNEISPELLKLLDKNKLTTLNDEEIIILNDENKIVYESGMDVFNLSSSYISLIKSNKEHFWQFGKDELLGIYIKENNENFIIVVKATDLYGFSKQRNLARMLFFGATIILFMSTFIGWFFVKTILSPIKKIINQIDEIKVSKLDLRLDEGKKKDELEQLSIRFNQMLDRIQAAFLSQKSFVSHASHELRTPLTSITGQIQVSLLANDDPEELRNMILSVLEDVQHLNKLSNNLLNLTSMDIENPQLNSSLINLIELLSRVRIDCLNKQPNGNVLIQYEDFENPPEFQGNEDLLKSAFQNLTENGLKYSLDRSITVKINENQENIFLIFENRSQKLQPDEMKNIFQPFMRGSNTNHQKGHGVGLPLAKRIMEIHNGSLEVSFKNNHIIFTAKLPRISKEKFN
jgi:signal transduction histidine kinase